MEQIPALYRALTGQKLPANQGEALSTLQQHIEKNRALGKATSGQRLQQLQTLKTSIQTIQDVQNVLAELSKTLNLSQVEKTAEQLELERLRKRIKILERNKTQKPKPSIDEGCAYLYVKTMGMNVDSSYEAYCASIIRQYFLIRENVEPKEELAILKSIFALHMANIKPFNYDLDNIRAYNDSISFKGLEADPHQRGFPWKLTILTLSGVLILMAAFKPPEP